MLLFILLLLTAFNLYMIIYYPDKPRIWINWMGAIVGTFAILTEFIKTFL